MPSGISSAFANEDRFGADWPEDDGRAITGAFCSSCHSLAIVKQQGLTRDGWDKLLVWMSEKQNMPAIEGEVRDTVLDYLAEHFGVDHRPRSDIAPSVSNIPPTNTNQGINRAPLTIRPKQ